VAAGAAGSLDRWGVEHLSPWAGRPSPHEPTLVEALVPLRHAHLGEAGHAAADLVTLPGQSLLSLLLLAAAAVVLRRRGRIEAAAGWVAAWAVGTVVEVVCKETLTRPALYRDGVHVVAFDSSWPSGHALRAALVAAALATVVPRAAPFLALWYASVPVLLVLSGTHTLTDAAGGLLLALLLAAVVRELDGSGLLRGRAGAARAGGAPAAGRSG
jgi:membrane-associated phospholipid phosphatase